MENVSSLVQKASEEIERCKSVEDLQSIEGGYLGRSGSITSLLKGIKDVAPVQTPCVDQAQHS